MASLKLADFQRILIPSYSFYVYHTLAPPAVKEKPASFPFRRQRNAACARNRFLR